jgi:hypothetical protein
VLCRQYSHEAPSQGVKATSLQRVLVPNKVYCVSFPQLLRCWGHINGFGTKQKTKYPIQPRLGVYSEDALRRYDFVLDQLSKVCCGLPV